MNHGEPGFEKGMRNFSVARECQKCGQLSLVSGKDSIYCTNCGYRENFTVAE